MFKNYSSINLYDHFTYNNEIIHNFTTIHDTLSLVPPSIAIFTIALQLFSALSFFFPIIERPSGFTTSHTPSDATTTPKQVLSISQTLISASPITPISFDTKSPKLPIYTNVNAKPYDDNTDIAENLSMQIKSPVLWQQTIENMIADGFTDFIEVGPGKTLCGLIKKISKDVNVYSAETDELTSQIASEVKCNA